MNLGLPLPDRAGRGRLEEHITNLVREMQRCGHGKDREQFEFLSKRLDLARKQFHALYGVKEHEHDAPIKST